MIEKLYRNNYYIESIPAVTETKCNRCQGENVYKHIDGKYYCMDCFNYGEIHDGMKLYRYNRNIPKNNHIIDLNYELTTKQKRGSDFLMDCYKNQRSGYLQAVCGAGKTEMSFELILQALNSNQRICFILPRVAVLKEVYKRFKKHFPKTNITALYEGHKNYEDANLVISTPQQLIYFYQEFDLIIVDEVDAFPFANNPFLQRLVKKTVKAYGVILYISATINKEFQLMIDSKKLNYHFIPSRYHGKPLAIPEFIRIKYKKMIFKEITDIYNNLRQTLIFIPTIEYGHKLLNALNNSYISAKFISSKTINKNLVIKSFKNKEFRILITTTILERGVTFPDIDCVVIEADNHVFTKSTLIQISGRVGRLSEFNTGKVTFYSGYLTKAMKDAKKEIIWMNKQNEMQAM